MIVTTAVKSLMILYCFSMVLAIHPAAASTTPAKQEVQQDAWIYYATDEEDTAYAFNPTNVERLKDDHVKVWVKALYAEKNKKYTEGQFRWEIDCAKKTMRGLAATIKKKDGTSEAITTTSDWSSIPAGSTAETLFDNVCSSKGKTK